MSTAFIKRMLFVGLLILALVTLAEDKAYMEIWEVDPDFARLRPTAIAVVLMDNFSLVQGISSQRLGRELKADAILMGQIEQSASIHSGLYDAVVVSTSLRLVDAKSGKVIWRTEQWRTAHRQWQIDPINLLLNMFAHAHASREGRIAYLVQEMMKTLPQGPVVRQADDLFNQAAEISVTP